MKVNTILFAALAGASLLAGSARATLIASDDFSYPDGNLAGLNGGTGWNSAWTTASGVATVASGQANINATAGAEIYRQIPTQGPGTEVWVRFAGQQFTDASPTATNSSYGGFDIWRGTANSTSVAIAGKGWPGPYRWTFALGGVVAISAQSTLSASVLYERIVTTATNTMILDLWINPTNPSVINTVTPDAHQVYSNANATGWSSVALRGGTGNGATESWRFDNIAIGTALADVAVPPSPVITSQPASATIYPGQNVSFKAQAAGNQPLVYQWWVNGAPLVNGSHISGATSNTLTIISAIPANAAANYYCVITNNLGSATSSLASLTLLSAPTFSGQSPGISAWSVPATNIIGVQIQEGNLLNTNAVVLTLDGAPVVPMITQNTNTLLTTFSYQPGSPLSLATLHTVQVRLTDNNNVSFTNTWNFHTGYPTLPVTISGPINDVSNAVDVIVFSAAGDGWLGTNYNASSSRTLYTRFSLAFNDKNGEYGVNGGLFGGLDFYQGTTEKLLVGNSWSGTTWDVTTLAPSPTTTTELSPLTLVNVGEWHTVVVRTDFIPNSKTTVSVWLDPDFTQTEANQPNAPVVVSADVTFDNIHLRCGNGTANASFSNIVMAATSAQAGFVAPADPQFQGFVPGVNATTVPPSSPIGLQVVVGGVGINTNNIAVTLDGTLVTASYSISGSIITVSYQPNTAFTANSMHTVAISLTDANNASYSANWSFTTDPYPTLPVNLTGPLTVSGDTDNTIFNAQNGWLGGNYGVNSTNTLYVRFSMTFHDVNGETGNGGCYGGLEFFQGGTEKLLIGNTWESTNWAVASVGQSENDFVPVTPVILNEWHTMLVKSVFVTGGQTMVKVWLDPDFTKTEGNQPNAPLAYIRNSTFDNIRLRCGSGTAQAEFTNVLVTATATGAGLAAPATPALLSIQPLGGSLQVSWTSVGTLQQASSISGPWTDTPVQANPQTVSSTNGTMFFRLRQ